MKGFVRGFIIFLFVILAILICVSIINPDSLPPWTGFASETIQQGSKQSKTLWDWLDLLIVPLLIALGVWYLGNIEKRTQILREKELWQRENTSNYLQLMTKLMIDNNLKSNNSREEVDTIARTQTLRFFRESEGDKKGSILQFLYESGLIMKDRQLNLKGANIENAVLDYISLIDAQLNGIFFTGSSINNAHLESGVFSGSDFSRCKMKDVILNDAILEYTDFNGADLRDAKFSNAKLEGVNFYKADLRGSDFSGADLAGANFYKADLRGSDFSGANLLQATFEEWSLKKSTYNINQIASSNIVQSTKCRIFLNLLK